MIVVKVELWSAITGEKTELARMHLSNDAEATLANHRLGSYLAQTFVGRDKAALDRGTVSKQAKVYNWRRLDYHIWNLVRRALEELGYDKGPVTKF